MARAIDGLQREIDKDHSKVKAKYLAVSDLLQLADEACLPTKC